MHDGLVGVHAVASGSIAVANSSSGEAAHRSFSHSVRARSASPIFTSALSAEKEQGRKRRRRQDQRGHTNCSST